jgi:hypothetical protein
MEEQYVGMQGDVFDSQRDMTCAIVGATLCMILAAIAQYEGHLPDDPRAMTMIEPEHRHYQEHR